MEMFKKIYLLLLNIKTKMGVKYVLIDSKHQRHHIDERGTTKIQVKLNQPIEHATTVEVSSFSTSNELYNVKTGENKFSFIVYNLSIASPTIKVYTFGVIPGMYTISDLVDTCNLQISGSDFTAVTNVTANFFLLSSNKVQLTTSSTGTGKRRLILYSSVTTFHNSIFNRLGFNRQQVFQSTDVYASHNFIYSDYNVNPLFTPSVSPELPKIKGISETVWRADNTNPLYWKTDQNEFFVGSQIGYETYQHLLLKSDLISNDLQKIYLDDNGSSHTISDNILEKIDMHVSSYNYIHWEKINPMVHQLSGKTVNQFTIELCDDNGRIFDTHESKNFTCILKFETADGNEAHINEINSLNNQRLGFLSRHNCGA